MTDAVDTVSPLDGEDGNVTGVTEQFPNVPEEQYSTRGQTTVATRHGVVFVPSNEALPAITPRGVKMSKEDADKVVGESRGRAFIRNTESEED